MNDSITLCVQRMGVRILSLRTDTPFEKRPEQGPRGSCIITYKENILAGELKENDSCILSGFWKE